MHFARAAMADEHASLWKNSRKSTSPLEHELLVRRVVVWCHVCCATITHVLKKTKSVSPNTVVFGPERSAPYAIRSWGGYPLHKHSLRNGWEEGTFSGKRNAQDTFRSLSSRGRRSRGFSPHTTSLWEIIMSAPSLTLTHLSLLIPLRRQISDVLSVKLARSDNSTWLVAVRTLTLNVLSFNKHDSRSQRTNNS